MCWNHFSNLYTLPIICYLFDNLVTPPNLNNVLGNLPVVYLGEIAEQLSLQMDHLNVVSSIIEVKHLNFATRKKNN